MSEGLEFFENDTDPALLDGEYKEPVVEEVVIPKEEPKEQPKEELKEEAQDEKKRDASIPRSRFDEVIKQRDAEKAERERLLKELEALKAPKEPPPAKVDVKQLEKDYIAAYEDGDIDKALNIREQINEELVRIAEEKAEKKAAEREENRTKAQIKTAVEKAVKSVYEQYPELEGKTAEDSEQVADIIDWRDVYIKRGMKADEAILKAAEKIMGGKAPDTKKDERQQKMLERNAQAAASQPPKMDGVGERAIPDDLSRAIDGDQDDWDKLSDKTRKSLLN